jgi:hypothetical protein
MFLEVLVLKFSLILILGTGSLALPVCYIYLDHLSFFLIIIVKSQLNLTKLIMNY